MKKIISLLLALLMLLSFTACSVDPETVELAADVALSLLEETDQAATETVEEAELPSEEIQDESSEEAVEPELPDETEIPEESEVPEEDEAPAIDEFGWYTTKEDVALYIYTYGRLPDNFMTKKEARNLGWEGGGLDPYAKDMCIGGDRFGNYEGILPDAQGRTWTECDIDTMNASSRGAKRIVFSNDGLIYYTEDHYESFTLLYGEE